METSIIVPFSIWNMLNGDFFDYLGREAHISEIFYVLVLLMIEPENYFYRGVQLLTIFRREEIVKCRIRIRSKKSKCRMMDGPG